MCILLSRKPSWMFINLCWKNCKKQFMGGNGHFARKGCLVTKIDINFFVWNEVLNISHITIFKKIFFSKITEKKNFGGPDHFSENEVSKDKNEYNLFYGKWSTEFGFQIFSSGYPILAEWKQKNQFWGQIFPRISGTVGPIVSKKIGFSHVWTRSYQSCEFNENWFKTATCIVTVIIIISWKYRN